MADDLWPAVHGYLTTAPTSEFVQQPVEKVAHWTGEENLLWRVACRGREAVVKLFLDAGQVRSRRQFDAQALFAPLGLAPAPLWQDRIPEGLPRPLMVYEWSEGAALAAGENLPDLALAVATVHRTEPSELRRFSPHPINLDYFWRIEQQSRSLVTDWLMTTPCTGLAALYTRLGEAAEQVVQAGLPQWRDAPPTVIHGDLRLQNVLVGRKGLLLLDWEMAGLGDPAYEIADFLQRHRLHIAPEALDAWLRLYLDAVDMPALAARIELYSRVLPFHAVNYLLMGLRQHTQPAPEPGLRDALPFLIETLAATLALAADRLGLALPDSAEPAADLYRWLNEQD